MTAAPTLILVQSNPIVGDIEGNAARMLKIWRENDNKNNIIIFPELALSGYPPQDLVLNAVFMKNIRHTIQEICEQTKNLDAAAIIPTPWKEKNNLYNAALVIEKGEISTVIKKHDLPNYAVFDEKRTFTSAPFPDALEIKGHRLGVLICEDIWNENIPRHLKQQGAKILIAINASPFTETKDTLRKKVTTRAIKDTGLDVIYLNIVGGQDELVFDGASYIQTQDEKILYQAASFEEQVFNFDLQTNKIIGSKSSSPAMDREETIYNAACLGMRDYIRKNGFQKALIGLSGGIDSALTAAMAVDALGEDNVNCVMLPSEFTSTESLKDAEECAKMLGVQYDIISIKEAVTIFEKIIPGLSGLAHENTQSRIRGVILMALSNQNGSMVITTGNKSEMAVGYCTIYGDMNGGFNPLKDIYKTDVFALSKWRNTKSPAIPQNIITKEPSAELRKDQKDQDSLPPYDLLDTILKCLIDYDHIEIKNAPIDIQTLMLECDEHPETVEKVAKLLKNSEYKRFQAAPGPRLSDKAFGFDRRYPMTNGFMNAVAK